MADYTLSLLAPDIELELDQYSTDMFNSGETSRELEFEVIADNGEEGSKIYSTDNKIQVIIKNVNGSFSGGREFKEWFNTISVTLRPFEVDSEDVRKILFRWASENNNTSEEIDPVKLINLTRTFEYPVVGQTEIDEGEDRISWFTLITYDYSYGGLSGDDVCVKANGLTLPILSFAHIINKDGTSSDSLTSPGDIKTVFTTRSIGYDMSFRYKKDNETMKQIARDVKTGNWLNEIYYIEYDDGVINDRLAMMISSGNISYTVDTNGASRLIIKAQFVEPMDIVKIKE